MENWVVGAATVIILILWWILRKRRGPQVTLRQAVDVSGVEKFYNDMDTPIPKEFPGNTTRLVSDHMSVFYSVNVVDAEVEEIIDLHVSGTSGWINAVYREGKLVRWTRNGNTLVYPEPSTQIAYLVHQLLDNIRTANFKAPILRGS